MTTSAITSDSDMRKDDQGKPSINVEQGQLQDSAIGIWLEKHRPADRLSEGTSKPEESSPHHSRGAALGGLRLLFLLLSRYLLRSV